MRRVRNLYRALEKVEAMLPEIEAGAVAAEAQKAQSLARVLIRDPASWPAMDALAERLGRCLPVTGVGMPTTAAVAAWMASDPEAVRLKGIIAERLGMLQNG